MSLKLRPHDAAGRVLPRAAVVALALGGLTASIVVADSAGATSRAKGLVISTTTNPKYGTILVSGTTVYTLKTASKVSVWRQVPEGLASGAVAEGREAGQGWERRECHQARHRQASGRCSPGDLCRQAALSGSTRTAGPTRSRVTSRTSGAPGRSSSCRVRPAVPCRPRPATSTTVPMTDTTMRRRTGATPGGGTTPPAGTTPTSPPAAPTTAPPPPTTTRADDHPHDLASHDDHDVRRRWWRRHRLLTLDRGTRGAAGTAPPVAVSRWWQGPARRAPTSPRAIVTAPTR